MCRSYLLCGFLCQCQVEYEIYSQALLALWGFAAVVISALPRVTARVKVQYCFAAGSTAWALNNTFHGRCGQVIDNSLIIPDR